MKIKQNLVLSGSTEMHRPPENDRGGGAGGASLSLRASISISNHDDVE